MRFRPQPRLLLPISCLAVIAAAARSYAAEEGGEQIGTWLNWLQHVKIGGRPLITDPAQLAFAWSLALVIALMLVAILGGRRFKVRPGPFQILLETAFGALRSIVESAMGTRGVGFLPFLATLFIYVLLMNIMGMAPGMLSPTSSLSTTLALALMVFLVVQFYGVKEHGAGYLRHFLEGLPEAQGVVAWLFLSPLAAMIFIVHLVGELFRPISLALRLFGNITAEETVAITMLGLVAAGRVFVPIPVHWPMMLLGLLTSFVQALIFTLLTAVYLGGVLSHEEGEAAQARVAAQP